MYIIEVRYLNSLTEIQFTIESVQLNVEFYLYIHKMVQPSPQSNFRIFLSEYFFTEGNSMSISNQCPFPPNPTPPPSPKLG